MGVRMRPAEAGIVLPDMLASQNASAVATPPVEWWLGTSPKISEMF